MGSDAIYVQEIHNTDNSNAPNYVSSLGNSVEALQFFIFATSSKEKGVSLKNSTQLLFKLLYACTPVYCCTNQSLGY